MMRAESKRLATVLDEKCAATPTHPAILYRDRTICYAELPDESLAAARSLFAPGIGRCDRVWILLATQPDWVVLWLAASYLAATPVPLNPGATHTDLAWSPRPCCLQFPVSSSPFH